MPRTGWTPSLAPKGDDPTVYLVDDFGRNGRIFREADIEATDLDTDVSSEIAQELRRRCELQMRDVPSSIQDFVERHEGRDRQLTLRLA
jgi:hypothetical protein